MTNLKKYKDKIKFEVRDSDVGDPLGCCLHYVKNGSFDCKYEFCHQCIADSLDWLLEGENDAEKIQINININTLNIECQEGEK